MINPTIGGTWPITLWQGFHSIIPIHQEITPLPIYGPEYNGPQPRPEYNAVRYRIYRVTIVCDIPVSFCITSIHLPADRPQMHLLTESNLHSNRTWHVLPYDTTLQFPSLHSEIHVRLSVQLYWNHRCLDPLTAARHTSKS